MPDQDPRERQMTVARVHAADGHLEVTFFESPRIYRLPRDNPAFETIRRELRPGAVLTIRLTEPHGDAIEGARPAR